jgi:uncharacterized membrane protein
MPAGAPPSSGPADPGPQQAYGAQQAYSQPQYGQQSYAPPPAQAAGLQDNLAGALCYLGSFITGIIFLAIAPYNQNRFIRFHAFQSIFFAVAWFAFWMANMILTMILPWSLTVVLSMLGLVVWLGGFVLWIVLMLKAYQGQRFKLPIIGDMAEKQA